MLSRILIKSLSTDFFNAGSVFLTIEIVVGSSACNALTIKTCKIEKVLLKVQSAMALQQGISGIAGAMDSFNMLAGTIKTKS